MKNKMYRIKLLFWKVLAHLGCKMSLRVDVRYDKEADVYVATSQDLPGLIVEAASIDDLIREVNDVAAMLLSEYLHNDRVVTKLVYHGLGSICIG